MADVDHLWRFLPLGYLFTVAVEAPILLLLLSPTHPLRRRLLAGFWLTACTYPIVVLAMPVLLGDAPRWAYLLVAETFAPAAECGLFVAAFGRQRVGWRDLLAIVVANLASFGLGELVPWSALRAWGLL